MHHASWYHERYPECYDDGIMHHGIMHHGIPSCIMVYHKWYPEWYDDGIMHFGILNIMMMVSCIMVS